MLWRKVRAGLSAGRVQSVATRLVVERERERMAFVRAGYWDLEGVFDPGSASPPDSSPSTARGSRPGRDFDTDGRLKTAGRRRARRGDGARRSPPASPARAFVVRSVEDRPYRRSPAAPFMTSTLQQEASRKLRMTSQVAMRVAQRLYENGHITYMRTDSTTLSESAIAAARAAATQIFGAENVADTPRQYARKVKNAQEAHEAIRPSGDVFRTPGELAREVSPRRAGALRPHLEAHRRVADVRRARPDGVGTPRRDRRRRARRRARRVRHGHHASAASWRPTRRAATSPRRGDDDERLACRRCRWATPWPSCRWSPRATRPSRPPASPRRRWSRRSRSAASAGRRPTPPRSRSILDRGYVFKKGTALVPTWLAFAVTKLLEQQFGDLVDYDFTAQMESDLDRIAAGEADRVAWLHDFYFGAADGTGGCARRAQGARRQPRRHRRA